MPSEIVHGRCALISKMKRAILTLFFSLSFLYSNSCSCFEGFKDYKGYPMTLSLAAKVFNNLTLIEIQHVDSAGAKALIIYDYCNSYDSDTIFIENMNPGWQCGFSTDEFKTGDKLLTVLALPDYKNYLSICYESYINVSDEEASGLISATKSAKAIIWKIFEIESQLGITIKN